ncbi:YdcF family protein [Emcibacter sp.]|uniref:YdcF family protein n=1 Tax=Emcibacter sp. TaxID=1979954 RepID=UPI002AA6D7C2|nr:YdcF family protein [Emcibacter sp.]
MEWGNFITRSIWALLQPSNSLLLILIIGLFLSWRRRIKCGLRLATFSLVCLILIGISPVGQWLAVPLEKRFADYRALPEGEFAGIIVLGGAEITYLSGVHDQAILSGRSERLIAGVKLARLFPGLQVIHTGGLGKEEGWTENKVAGSFFSDVGLDPARVLFDNKAYNTWTNATESLQLIRDKGLDDKGTWLLVTSANHMPRSVGAFRKAGFKVRPYPVDFGTDLTYTSFPDFESGKNLGVFDDTAHEWLGLLVYYATGRSSSLFPDTEDLK